MNDKRARIVIGPERVVLAVVAARNYLPRQRYRLSRQIAHGVSRHFAVPLLSFLIRRRDKRGRAESGRAGPGRAVPFRTDSPSRHDRFSHRATAPGEILFLPRLLRRRTARSIRPPICRRGTKRSAEKANRNFLRLFNRPRRTFFEFSGHAAWRGAERRGEERRGAAAAGWYLARPVSLVFFCSQRETSENSPRRSHAAGDFQRILLRRRNPLARKHFVPEIYLLETSSESIELCSDAAQLFFSETSWIFMPHLKTLKNMLDFCFRIKNVYDFLI